MPKVKDRPDISARRNYVYFGRGLLSGLIKIGFSYRPPERIGSLKHQYKEDIDILFTVPGGPQRESFYHRKFRESRYEGEWFYENGRLHEFLKRRGHGGTRTILEKQIVLRPGPEKIVEVLKPIFVEKISKSAGPRPLLIGYARVSTDDQNLDVQLSALRDAGVVDANMFVEKIGAMNAKRFEFRAMMKTVERGDTLVVHSLSRLGRDVRQIHEILATLDKDGVAWRSITEPHLNNATAVGRLMLNVTGAMAQFERDQIKERTVRGMQELKRRGVKLGRQRIVTTEIRKAMQKLRRQKMPVTEIAQKFGIKPNTVYAYTKAA